MNIFKNILCVIIIACVASSSVLAVIPMQLAQQVIKQSGRIVAGTALGATGVLVSGGGVYACSQALPYIYERKDSAGSKNEAIKHELVKHSYLSIASLACIISPLSISVLGTLVARDGVKALRLLVRR